ncbi:MAG: hypothetical protein OXM00_05385 [Paracoccaceae bacterium]|nr:hypothetical protein [Paracoccaceae bacterium]
MAELVYVDEQHAQANQVLRSAVGSAQFTQDEVVKVIPAASIDETIDVILSHHCKVLITDYRLSEHKADVEFTGADLVREFQRRFDRFPCFVTTAFAEEAADDELDTNIIFPKSDFLSVELTDEPMHASDLPFFLRVRKKINEYEAFVANTTQELEQLRVKSENEELSAEEAERLIQLDDLVEAMFGNHHAVESHLKRQALDPFQRIIDKAEALILKIEREIDPT